MSDYYRDETDGTPQGKPKHANRHVGKFLKLPSLDEEDDIHGPIQLIRDGRRLTSQRLLQGQGLTLTKPILVDDKPQSIGMKMMEFPKGRQVTVRDVADLLGHHYPVHVIDVEHQEELEGWTLTDLVDYFEDEERMILQQQDEFQAAQECKNAKKRRRRKAAEKCMNLNQQQRPRVLNQISLEFSKTALSEKILSPQFVREIDWIDHAWPRRTNRDGTLARPIDEIYPNVQYYCLTSAAGCYTDFHLDFGGTSVWYHILNGEKVFCLIPPTKENLAIYEDWLCRPDQAEVFLPDLIPNPKENVLKISLKEKQTLVIPTAWIHAVYTPMDSLVIGGNFLHGLDISLQLEVHCIESRTRVPEQFRFPFFLPLNFYAGGYYLDKLRRGNVSKREVDSIGELIDALEEWWKLDSNSHSRLQTGPTVYSAASECAKNNDCSSVDEFLSELRREHQRVTQDGIKASLVLPTKSKAVTGDLTSPSKPKLRLSLKGKTVTGPPAPKLEPSSGEIAKQTGAASPGGSGRFRIVVPSSKWNAAAPNRQKRPREDTEWIDDGLTVEDEWIPAGSNKGKRKSASGPKPPGKAKAAAPPRPQAKSSTSRQRLMKRIR